MRKLCGNSPITKQGGWCVTCAQEALERCLCSEIYQPRIASKVRSVRKSANERLRRRRGQCVHHRPQIATDDEAETGAIPDDEYKLGEDIIPDDNDDEECDDDMDKSDDDDLADKDIDTTTPMDLGSDESDEEPLEGTVEAYVAQEMKSNMPLVSCVGKDITMVGNTQDKTLRWQAICSESGWAIDAQEYPKVAEGSRSIAMQFLILITYFFTEGLVWPTHLAIDDACHVKRSVMEMLVELVQGRADLGGIAPWVLITLAVCDMCIDGFHFMNHKELWCMIMLDPKSRTLLRGLNTQCVEQLWKRLVRSGSMLRYMNRGAHRLMYYTLLQYHNEKLLGERVARKVPIPKMNHKARTKTARMRTKVETLFDTTPGSGRFTVKKGTEAYSPQLNDERFTHMNLNIMKQHEEYWMESLKSSGLLSAATPSPTDKLRAIVFLQDIVASVHGVHRPPK
jgi:hypothetical protein